MEYLDFVLQSVLLLDCFYNKIFEFVPMHQYKNSFTNKILHTQNLEK